MPGGGRAPGRIAGAGAALILALGSGGASAQTIAAPDGRMPPQINPQVLDPGTPRFDAGGGGAIFGEGSGSRYPAGPLAMGAPAMGAPGGSNALDRLVAQPYGRAAVEAAQGIGVNPAATAAIAAAESNFRDVPTANGSTSATGPWQITQGTFTDTVRRHGLNYTSADIAKPEAQAVVSNYVIRDYAAATQNAIGRPVTTQEAWGSYLFGPKYGPQVATASGDTALSTVVPASYLANNGMQNFSVQDFNNYAARRLGSGASQPALLPRPGA